jgi:hypothetical protein
MALNTQTVGATHIHGASILGRSCCATEAICPVCGTRNLYRHSDSHYSMGVWYGCKHLAAFSWSDSGDIESVEFKDVCVEMVEA